jgi:predicted nucleic acid-binding protein
VAVLFFDTAALVRRYDRSEPGAQQVRSLCRSTRGHLLVIAEITPIEFRSAIARKHREGTISRDRRQALWSLFREHWRTRYRLVALDERVRQRAMQLVFAHPLRTLDAIQLASALALAASLARLTPDMRFCTADRRLAGTATTEGLTVALIQ